MLKRPEGLKVLKRRSNYSCLLRLLLVTLIPNDPNKILAEFCIRLCANVLLHNVILHNQDLAINENDYALVIL